MKKTITILALILTISFSNCSKDEKNESLKEKKLTEEKSKPKTEYTKPKEEECKEVLYTTSSQGNKIYKDCNNKYYIYDVNGEKSTIKEWECGKYKEHTLITSPDGDCYYLDDNFEKHYVNSNNCKECHK